MNIEKELFHREFQSFQISNRAWNYWKELRHFLKFALELIGIRSLLNIFAHPYSYLYLMALMLVFFFLALTIVLSDNNDTNGLADLWTFPWSKLPKKLIIISAFFCAEIVLLFFIFMEPFSIEFRIGFTLMLSVIGFFLSYVSRPGHHQPPQVFIIHERP